MSLTGFPTIIGYGNVRWGSLVDTVSMSVRPILDIAGRSVKHLQYDFTLKFIVGESSQDVGLSCDLEMAGIRAELSRVGLEFHYLNTGYGGLQSVPAGQANTFGLPTNSRDILWGPKPQVLSWKPNGRQTAEVVWACQINLAPCPEDAAYEDGLLQWCYKISYQIDESGYTTKNISGTAQVVGYRSGGPTSRTIADHGDRVRERIEPPLSSGFRRLQRIFTLSEDKTKLDYQFTDTEEPPNTPPAGCVRVNASHTVSTNSIYSIKWKGTLQATYEVSRDTPRTTAYNMFFQLVQERIRSKTNQIINIGQNKNIRNVVFYRSFEATEPEIYGKQTAQFRLEYSFNCSLLSLIQATGLWTPITTAGGNWAAWSASMSPRAWHVRGNARLKFDPTQEAIIDICEDTQPGKNLTAALPKTPNRNLQAKLINEIPDPKNSWTFWLSTITIQQTDETIELKPLPQMESPAYRKAELKPDRLTTRPTSGYSLQTQPTQAEQEGFLVIGKVPGKSIQPIAESPRAVNKSIELVTQQRTESTFVAILRGMATRVGYPIIPPSLREIGGRKATLANQANLGDGFTTGTCGVYFDVPEYYCYWQLRYIIEGKPEGNLPEMETPF